MAGEGQHPGVYGRVFAFLFILLRPPAAPPLPPSPKCNPPTWDIGSMKAGREKGFGKGTSIPAAEVVGRISLSLWFLPSSAHVMDVDGC